MALERPVWNAMIAPATWVAMTEMRTMAPRMMPMASSWKIRPIMAMTSSGMAGRLGDSSG
ncbi:hypothetical protein D3C87_1998130 [compost metagenome]